MLCSSVRKTLLGGIVIAKGASEASEIVACIPHAVPYHGLLFWMASAAVLGAAPAIRDKFRSIGPKMLRG